MSQAKTILYCEDDPVTLMAYRRPLQLAGYHVISALDGLEAMKNLALFIPDMVLMDLVMPKFNGEEVLHFICKNERLAKVPLIILSSNSVLDVATEPFLECANKRLIKEHCTPALLLETVRELFNEQLQATPVH